MEASLVRGTWLGAWKWAGGGTAWSWESLVGAVGRGLAWGVVFSGGVRTGGGGAGPGAGDPGPAPLHSSGPGTGWGNPLGVCSCSG